MPLQNRVDPYGTIFRSPARGTFMGNRGGALHNENREIVRQYKSRRWITCVLGNRPLNSLRLCGFLAQLPSRTTR
jgi:hypothetical protein